MDLSQNPLIGISACLTGSKVRYDGGHRLEKDLWEAWGPHVRFVPLCPEAEGGLGIPREPMKLVRIDGTLRAIGRESGKDHSGAIRDWSLDKLRKLKEADLSGIILKTRSPSCAGDQSPDGEFLDGILADLLDRELPLVARTDEKNLREPAGREHYLSRLLALMAWRRTKERDPTQSGLAGYHMANRLRLLSHNPREANLLGRVAANPSAIPIAERLAAYERGLCHCLSIRPAPQNHLIILNHLAAVLEKARSVGEIGELRNEIENYRRGGTPLTEVRRSASRIAGKSKGTFPADQTYLKLHPLEIAVG